MKSAADSAGLTPSSLLLLQFNPKHARLASTNPGGALQVSVTCLQMFTGGAFRDVVRNVTASTRGCFWWLTGSCASSTSASSHADDSTAVKVACYILISVGAFSMLLGFLGCLGAIYEVRCLLGLVSSGGLAMKTLPVPPLISASDEVTMSSSHRCDAFRLSSPSTSPASC